MNSSQVPTSTASIESTPPLSTRQWISSVALVAMCGAIMGLAAKRFDNTPVIGEIGTHLGVWVFTVSLIAAFSRTPLQAALLVPLFLGAMLAAYYVYSMALFGFFPRRELLYWAGIAAASPVGAWIVWHGRGKGWVAALCASLPVALLVVEGYPAVYTRRAALAFDLVAAIALLGLLARSARQMLITGACAAIVFVVLQRVDVLSRVLSGP